MLKTSTLRAGDSFKYEGQFIRVEADSAGLGLEDLGKNEPAIPLPLKPQARASGGTVDAQALAGVLKPDFAAEPPTKAIIDEATLAVKSTGRGTPLVFQFTIGTTGPATS